MLFKLHMFDLYNGWQGFQSRIYNIVSTSTPYKSVFYAQLSSG
jgi:hypothetical protein